MRIDTFDTDQRVFIVAEIGNNHEGNPDVAKRMLEAAAKTGVDAVKFQTLRADKLIRPQDKERFKVIKNFELSFSEFEELANAARDEGVIFLSTPFDLEAADFLNDLMPAIKIASGDNNFIPLLKHVAGFGKPVIMSGGLAELDQLMSVKHLMETEWAEQNADAELAILHCVTSYPTPVEEANLAFLHVLKAKTGGCVGYSDHCLGIEAAAASVSAGARIVEKHFTLDKNYSSFRDHQLSADPDEMSELVARIRELEILFGQSKNWITDSEKGNLVPVRRSIAASKDLKAGHCISREDICWLRPGEGVSPGNEEVFLGKEIKTDIPKGTLLQRSMLR
jgi:N,N'-diacetyllegionaminate synthase